MNLAKVRFDAIRAERYAGRNKISFPCIFSLNTSARDDWTGLSFSGLVWSLGSIQGLGMHSPKFHRQHRPVTLATCRCFFKNLHGRKNELLKTDSKMRMNGIAGVVLDAKEPLTTKPDSDSTSVGRSVEPTLLRIGLVEC